MKNRHAGFHPRDYAHRNRAFAAALGAALVLTACGGGGAVTGNSVSAEVQNKNVVGAVGKEAGTAATVNFKTSTGIATHLTIDTASLPAGWSAPSANVCQSVDSTNGCAATLTYTPTETTRAEQTLTLTYRYLDNHSKPQSGSTSLKYSARQAFLYVAQPTNTPVAELPNDTGPLAPGSIMRCSTRADGSLDACSDSGAAGLQSPARILFDGTSAYVSQIADLKAFRKGNALEKGSGTLLRCSVDSSSGALSGCVDSGVVGLTAPLGLAIHRTNLYVLDTNGQGAFNSVQRCDLGRDGAVSNCAALDASGLKDGDLDEPTSLAAHNGNLYMTSGADYVTVRCPIKSDGTLDTCSTTPAEVAAADADAVGATDIGFNRTTAYIVGGENPRALLQCPVSNDGSLSACATTGLPEPAQLQEVTPGPSLGVGFIGRTAYISTFAATGLIQCKLKEDGTIDGDCTAPTTPALNTLSGLATY